MNEPMRLLLAAHLEADAEQSSAAETAHFDQLAARAFESFREYGVTLDDNAASAVTVFASELTRAYSLASRGCPCIRCQLAGSVALRDVLLAVSHATAERLRGSK